VDFPVSKPLRTPLKVLVVGYGRMGTAHTQAYASLPGFEVVGIVHRSRDLSPALSPAAETPPSAPPLHIPSFESYEDALRITRPDAVSINTYPDTHAAYALMALDAGAHVFVEKPLATALADAEAVIAKARATKRTLLVGYILQHHPAYDRFIAEAKTLGKPLVMRMSLNQQSHGPAWQKHRHLLAYGSPLLDCGVHYVDLMVAAISANNDPTAPSPKPIHVQAMGARLSEDLAPGEINYGQMQIRFSDGSIGWFEAAFGPMVSQAAKDLRDIVGPNGSITLQHTSQGLRLLRHYATLNATGQFANTDALIDIQPEPNHADLCRAEQAFFLQAITEQIDLTQHHERAVQSLKAVLAAEASLRCGEPVALG
jgi:predicted dehydrogenase